MTKQMNISKKAQAYVNSLIEQGKLFTANTIKKFFPSEKLEDINNYINEILKNSNYMVFAGFIPRDIMALNNKTKCTSVSVKAQRNIVSGVEITHVSLDSKTVKNLGLSVRQYCYSIKGDEIIIHRSSTSNKHDKFQVWNNGRAIIPVDKIQKYTIILK